MQDIGSLDSAQGGLVPPAEHTPPPALDAGASGEAEQDWLGQPLRAGAEFELPDWLRQLEGEAGPPAAPGEAMPSAPAEEPAGEEPDWLAAIREPSAPETPAEEAPDWLAALRDQPQTEATGEELATEAPEWLSAVSDVAEAPTAEPAVEEPSVQVDVPDWLRGLTTTPAAGETVQEQEAAPASEEVAGWLREVSAGYPEPAGGVSAFIGEDIELADQAETPDWLADVVQPPPPAAAPEPAPVEVPEWLRELGPVPAPALSSVEGAEDRPEETPFGEVPSAVAGDIPEWLRGMQPGQAPPAFADEAGRSLAPAEAGLEAAAIPSWLQALRPTEAAGAPAMPEEGVAETEGLLAELRNVLPAMPFMGQSHGAPAIRHAEIPAADLARAGLFQELLARGALAPTIVQPSLGRRARAAGGPRLISIIRARFGYWLIAALLITSVIVPNGFSFVQNIFQLGNAGAGLYQPAAERIAALNTSDRVLLAFDYDAFQAAEMDAIAQAFLTHIRQRGADVIAVSLNPTGPALAERVLAELKDAGLPDAAFVQQRYFPGQAVGAQSALVSTQADLVVVLAGSPEAMRVWVEQVSAAGLPMPIVAGVSAGVLPQVRPYVQSAQVMQPVTGLMGGLAYQRSLDPNPDAGNEALNRTVQSEALYLSQLTFAAILIIGLIVSLMAGTRRTG